MDDSFFLVQKSHTREGRQAFLHAADLTLIAENLAHMEELVPAVLPLRDPMLGREDPEPGEGCVPEGGPITNCPPPIACSTTLSRCPLTSNIRFGGKTGEDHPS